MRRQKKNHSGTVRQGDLARLALRLVEPSRHNTGLTFPAMDLPRGIRVFVRTRIGYGAEAAPNLNMVKHVLIVNLRGEGEVILDGVAMKFHPGESLVIRPDQFHHYAKSHQAALVWLFIGFDLRESMLASFAQHGPLPLQRADWEYLRRILADYLDVFNDANGIEPGFAAVLSSGRVTVMLWLLLMSLAERQRRLYIGESAGEGNLGDLTLVKKAQAYLLEHLNQPIRIHDMARHAGVSPTRLCQVFQSAVGRSLGRTIRQSRVNRAAMLLVESDLEVKEVANACGFSSVSAFCRTFHRIVGMPPRRYRELRRPPPGPDRAIQPKKRARAEERAK